MSDSTSTTEGKMTWTVPNAGLECQTWYKITGNLKSNTRPLVILHGGPGVPSDYLFPLSFLSFHYYIPVLIYDQIGSGRSTHFPDKMGDTEFWTEQLFLDELKALLQHLNIYDDYDLLGHSWGGMLGSRHASRQPGGLKHLIIMSSPASMDDWIKAQEAHRRKLPQNVQDALDRCEKEGKTDSKEYQDAVNVYYSHHLCRVSPMPELLQQSFAGLEQDPTVYFTMNGPNEFFITGSMKTWSILDEASKISTPTLLLNGAYDEAADSVIYPFFKSIPHVKWVQFANSSHMSHLEEPERFSSTVVSFIRE